MKFVFRNMNDKDDDEQQQLQQLQKQIKKDMGKCIRNGI